MNDSNEGQTPEEQMREEFERHHSCRFSAERFLKHNNGYWDCEVDGIWQAWQACAAKSAEKIARLKTDVAHYKQISHVQEQGWAQTCERAAAAQADNARLREALKFYADGSHFVLFNPDAWDTCSGEPMNFQFDENDTAQVEDGYVAKQALAQPLDTSALDTYVAKNTGKWISVEDRLPECDMTPNSFGVQILVYPPMQETGCTPMNVAFYGCRQTDEPNFYIFGRVFEPTHWMPLPPAPEKE